MQHGSRRIGERDLGLGAEIVAARVLDVLLDALAPGVELWNGSMRRRREHDERLRNASIDIEVRALPGAMAWPALARCEGRVGRRLDQRAAGAEGQQGLEWAADVTPVPQSYSWMVVTHVPVRPGDAPVADAGLEAVNRAAAPASIARPDSARIGMGLLEVMKSLLVVNSCVITPWMTAGRDDMDREASSPWSAAEGGMEFL